MALTEFNPSEDQKRYGEMQRIFDALKCSFHLDCECGARFVYSGIPDSYANEANATRDAYEFGWRVIDGRVLCPKCIENQQENNDGK